MLKNLIIVIVFLLLFSTAFAKITILKPVEKELSSGETVVLGDMQPGETLELIVSADAGFVEDVRWNEISITAETMPDFWLVESKEVSARSLVMHIRVPANAPKQSYTLRIVLSAESKSVADQHIDAVLSLKEGLLTSSITNLEQQALVDEEVSYEAVIINDSIATHKLILKTSPIGRSWFTPLYLEVQPGKTLTQTLFLTPKISGNKNFQFVLDSESQGKRLAAFDAKLFVNPTLKGKFHAANYGFPFFTIGLLPLYLIDSFISFHLA